jgi:hypothetical protein
MRICAETGVGVVCVLLNEGASRSTARRLAAAIRT